MGDAKAGDGFVDCMERSVWPSQKQGGGESYVALSYVDDM